jgi:hypothetical protein
MLRPGSAGSNTTLSYSDLLLSVAANQLRSHCQHC